MYCMLSRSHDFEFQSHDSSDSVKLEGFSEKMNI